MAEKQKRGARGAGTIRQRPDGRWEARFVTGVDPGTGKDIRRSVYAYTQREARKKMTEAIAALDRGTYKEPCRMTLGQWLDIWTTEYLNSIKPRTLEAYLSIIKTHIRPGLGAVRLEQMNAHTIQKFYNSLDGLSPKTVKNVHGVLHKALQQAAAIGYMTANPADACTLPRAEKPELHPLDEDDTGLFIEAVKGHRYEAVFLFTLFTGARQGEVLGLTWDCVDFTTGTVTINKQLQKAPRGSEYSLVSPKNGKGRTISPAPFVMRLLKEQRRRQAAWQLRAGPSWEGSGLVFTDELGRHLMPHTVYHAFKKVVASIRAGDDIKTVQGNLGHATASFTLDVYGHVTEQMKQASAARMEKYIRALWGADFYPLKYPLCRFVAFHVVYLFTEKVSLFGHKRSLSFTFYCCLHSGAGSNPVTRTKKCLKIGRKADFQALFVMLIFLDPFTDPLSDPLTGEQSRTDRTMQVEKGGPHGI